MQQRIQGTFHESICEIRQSDSRRLLVRGIRIDINLYYLKENEDNSCLMVRIVVNVSYSTQRWGILILTW